MSYVRLFSLILLTLVLGYGFYTTDQMSKHLDSLTAQLDLKQRSDQETTRRVQDVERDFRLIRDEL